jgi:heme/copper-type cytochrome/quinol oxidase subunit 4
MMKIFANMLNRTIILFMFLFMFSGCQVVGDIFKAGVWFGVIGVIVVVAVIIWLISKAGGNK